MDKNGIVQGNFRNFDEKMLYVNVDVNKANQNKG